MSEQDSIDKAKAASERGEFESAIALLRPLADTGNREAQYQLGFLALTECDLISGREAFSLFRAAAEQGTRTPCTTWLPSGLLSCRGVHISVVCATSLDMVASGC